MTYLKKPVRGDTQPGIHVLLIGVSNYFHLPGGKKTPFPEGAGFQPLDAPDFSCRKLGDWFSQERLAHPTLDIKSIDLLASNVKFGLHPDRVTVDVPTFANVQAAVDRWFTLGNLSPDNLLIFYFCGHGLQQGVASHSLLCADFGSLSNNPFAHAVHYEGLEAGMRTCAAKQQVYLLDICRRTDQEIDRKFSGPGSALVGRLAPMDSTDVAQSVIWATSGGREAWGRDRSPSAFAEAFIKSFDGAAATTHSRMNGMFATPKSISTATAAWIDAKREIQQEPQLSQPVGQNFILHKFDTFKVPVFVRCDPNERTEEADLSCWQENRRVKGRSGGRGYDYWHVDLPQGTYTFRAELEDLVIETSQMMIYPPLIPVFIEV